MARVETSHHRLIFCAAVLAGRSAVLLAVLAAAGSHGTPAAVAVADETLLFGDIPSVYGASRYEQTTSEAPASVSVITAEEIARHGWRTLADVLRSVRGIYATYDRNYTYLGVRGFARPGDYNSRVLVLVDGHRVNDNVYGAAYFGTEALVDVALIERIEVIRGPASSLYGTSAFFGVINVVTKRGRDLAGAQAEASVASHGTSSARLTWGERFGSRAEAAVSASWYGSDGPDLYFPEYDDPTTLDGRAEGLDGDRRASALATVVRGDWRFGVAYVDREKEIPTGAYGIDFGDPRAKTVDRTIEVRGGWDHTLEDQSRLSVSLAYDDYAYEGSYPYDGTIFRDYGKGAWWTLDVQHDRRLGERHRLVVGATGQWNVRQDQGGEYLDPPLVVFRDARRSTQWAVFGQDEFRIGRGWTAVVGVRHDHYDTFGGTTNPRAAVIWGSDRPTTLKFLFGRAFRAPNTYELFYDDQMTTKANPDLEPERVETWEVIVERSIGTRARGSLSVYQLSIDDLISLTTDPEDGFFVFRNLDRSKGRGIEVELGVSAPGGVDGRFSWAVQDSEDRGTGATLSNSPRHLGKLNINGAFAGGKLGWGAEAQYTGKRVSPAGAEIGGFTVVNVNLLARKFARGLEMSLGVFNAFDRDYADPASEEFLQTGISQDGQTYRFVVRYAF